MDLLSLQGGESRPKGSVLQVFEFHLGGSTEGPEGDPRGTQSRREQSPSEALNGEARNAKERAAGSSAGAAASSSVAGPSDKKGEKCGSRGDPVVSTDRAVPESRDDEEWSWSWTDWRDYNKGRWDGWDWQHGGHQEWEDRQGRDDYYLYPWETRIF